MIVDPRSYSLPKTNARVLELLDMRLPAAGKVLDLGVNIDLHGGLPMQDCERRTREVTPAINQRRT